MKQFEVSGKRVVLVMLVLIALWAAVLSVLVWRGARTAHYTRLKDAPEAGAGALR